MNGTEYINENSNNFRMSGRIEKIQKLAQREGVSTDQVKIHVGNDWEWNRRRNRTAAQQKAVKIGQTNSTSHGHSLETVFAWVE
jgi:hypothetical protein